MGQVTQDRPDVIAAGLNTRPCASCLQRNDHLNASECGDWLAGSFQPLDVEQLRVTIIEIVDGAARFV